MRFFVRDNHNDFRCLGAMLAVVATAGLLLSAVPAEAADLTGGKQAKFFDKDGTRKDKMQVRFHKDPGVTAPLPNPASSGSSITVVYGNGGQTTTIGPVTLPSANWETRYPEEYYRYRDRYRSTLGIQDIQFYTAIGGGPGGLQIKSRGDSYGVSALTGPVEYVEVSLSIGSTTWCGRFDPTVSRHNKNEAGKVIFSRGSGVCTGDTGGGGGPGGGGTGTTIRVPAEWEEQEAVWIQWPGQWERVYEPAFGNMATVIADYQKLHILYASNTIRQRARNFITNAGGNPDHANIIWHSINNDNAWMRDNGPVYVVQDGEMRIQDWEFDAWGDGFGPNIPYAADDAVPVRVGAFLGMPVDPVSIVHERGNLEFNGSDSVILNWSTIGDPERNPGYTRAQAIADMKRYFGVDKVVLTEGYLQSDGTRGHIDGIARFISPTTVVVGQCTTNSVCQPGDNEAAVFDDAADDIAAAGFTVIREPFEGKVLYNGEWFDTDYMNWLVGNGFVIAVGFGDVQLNAAAQARLEQYYPGRTVYVIDMLASWDAGGGAHCHTNDQPAASTVAGYTPWVP